MRCHLIAASVSVVTPNGDVVKEKNDDDQCIQVFRLTNSLYHVLHIKSDDSKPVRVHVHIYPHDTRVGVVAPGEDLAVHLSLLQPCDVCVRFIRNECIEELLFHLAYPSKKAE